MLGSTVSSLCSYFPTFLVLPNTCFISSLFLWIFFTFSFSMLRVLIYNTTGSYFYYRTLKLNLFSLFLALILSSRNFLTNYFLFQEWFDELHSFFIKPLILRIKSASQNPLWSVDKDLYFYQLIVPIVSLLNLLV